MTTHISLTVLSCFGILRQIRSVQRSLPVMSLVTSLVLTRLDYCNSVLVGLLANLLNWLQAVINAAARLICSAKKSEHITPILMDLHWLRIQERIQYKLCTVQVFKCSSASTAWHLHISLSSYNRSRSWSHDSASDLPACQHSSCQRPEGQRSVTDLFLLPAPGLGTVCRSLLPRRPLCHHSVDSLPEISSVHNQQSAK